MRQATTAEHLFDHRVFNPYCKHCCRAKAQRKRRDRSAVDLGPPSKVFGTHTTGDHLISRKRKLVDGEGDTIPEDTGEALFGDEECEDDGLESHGEDFSFLTKPAKDAVVMYDRGTDYGDMFPKGTKTTEDTLAAFREWTKPDDKILSFYADNAPELKAAAKELGWRNATGTPGQPKTNGVIENKVRLTKGCTKV